MENNQSSFWQFSDQLRLQTNNLANISLNDSIWSNSYVPKRTEDRRNFDIRVGGEVNSGNSVSGLKTNLNSFSNDGWKVGNNYGYGSLGSSGKSVVDVGVGLNGGFNKGIYNNPVMNFGYSKGTNNVVVNSKGIYGKGGKGNEVDEIHGLGHGGSKIGKKNKNKDPNKDNSNKADSDHKNAVDKRFKTLPPSESLPRNETVGGYIFVCNNDTMQENLKRQLFGKFSSLSLGFLLLCRA